MLWMMKRAATKVSNVKHRMLWQHHNKPIELWSQEVIMQKLEYIHQNPVVAGFVPEAEHWKYSSAINYNGKEGVMDVLFLR